MIDNKFTLLNDLIDNWFRSLLIMTEGDDKYIKCIFGACVLFVKRTFFIVRACVFIFFTSL